MTNDLTQDQRESLTILQEECAEVIHAVSKILRHGPESRNPDNVNSLTNRMHLHKEIGQLIFMLSVCFAAGAIEDETQAGIEEIMKNKMQNLRKYSDISNLTLNKVEL